MRKNFKSGIYQIKNEINQKVYIGHSIDILKRWGWHKNRLRYQKHSNTHLQNAWSKYTETNFSFRILELIESPTKEQLEEREDYWIDFYESDKDEKGYNKQKAQQGTFTEKWHQKERERKKEKQTVALEHGEPRGEVHTAEQYPWRRVWGRAARCDGQTLSGRAE